LSREGEERREALKLGTESSACIAEKSDTDRLAYPLDPVKRLDRMETQLSRMTRFLHVEEAKRMATDSET
jgi:hypothetical protein